MREHDARLGPAALASLVACAIAAQSGTWARWALAAGGVALALAVLAWALTRAARGPRGVRRRTARDLAVAAAFAAATVALVTGAAAARHQASAPPEVRGAIAHGEPIRVVAVVASDPEPAAPDAYTGEARQRMILQVQAACALPCTADARARATLSLAATFAGTPPGLGERIVAEGGTSPNTDSRRDGRLWVQDWEPLDRPAGASAWAAGPRDAARHAARGLPDEVRALTLGMVTGDTSAMSAAQEDAMRITGLTHLTAVSGSHFAIITMALGWALRRATTGAAVRWGRATRLARAVLIAAAMGALAVIVLPEPSVQRALTMALAVAAGVALGRPAPALPALGAGVIVLLVIEPGLGGAVGLQLSVAAVVAIVVWAPRIAAALRRWLLPGAATAVAVPAAAWLACWPLLVALRPGVGPYAIPANLVAAVAALPVTLIGLAAMLVALVWPAGGAALMELAGACAWPVAWSAEAFSLAPGAWLAWPEGGWGVALAAAIVLLLAAASLARGLVPAVRLAATLVAAALGLAGPALWVTDAAATDDWAVVVCDVGQGDAMLVRVGEDAAVMIDTGPPGGAGAACLERYGVTHVPLLVLTHPHADHDGAVSEVAGVSRIGEAWVSGATALPGHEAALAQLAALGVPTRVPAAGELWQRGDASLLVLFAGGASQGGSDAAVNDASLAVWASTHGVTALGLGDLEDAGQAALARALGGGLTVDLIKVAHHGSATQSAQLAGLLTARVAALSVGQGNAYGHPAPRTEELYAARASVVLATMACGDISLTTDAALATSRQGDACRAGMAG